MQLPNLPPEIDAKMGKLSEKILARRLANDFDEVLALTEASWQLLPEPRVNWNFEPQAIAFGAVEDIALAGRPEFAALLDTWLERMYAAYFDPERKNLLLRMVEGEALHAVDRRTEAVVVFQYGYDAEGAAWFGGRYALFLHTVQRRRTNHAEQEPG